jgi:DNA-binding NarL/FixJ family response regulator
MTIRVLIVDDHPVVRAGLRALLDAELDLALVGEADAGIPAISLARELRPDVVLTDLLLPDVDGVAVTQAIRSECPDVQVVILTSVTEEDASVVHAVQAGAIGYVVKDADTHVLVQAIRAAANGQVHLSPRAASRLMQEMRAPNKQANLTERQRQVLREIAFGRTNKEIARSLHLGLSTVKCTSGLFWTSSASRAEHKLHSKGCGRKHYRWKNSKLEEPHRISRLNRNSTRGWLHRHGDAYASPWFRRPGAAGAAGHLHDAGGDTGAFGRAGGG